MAYQLPVMGTDYDCRTLSVYLLEESHDFIGQLWVEVSGRLISQEYLGIIDDCPGYGHSLLFAVGQLCWVFPHLVMEIDHPQGVKDSPPDFLAGNTQDLKDDSHVLKDSLLEKKPEILEDDPHASSYLVDPVVRNAEDISVVDDDLAMGRKDLPKYQFKKGCLPRTRGPGDEEKVSFLNMEGNVGESPSRSLILL